MKNDDAIKWLIKPTITSTEVSPTKAKELEAYNMAVDALSAEATIGDYPNDLISRSALMEYCSNQKSKSIDNNDIARFPSAEAVQGDAISKRFISDAILQKISELNAQGEKAIPIAREFIRFKRFVDGLTPIRTEAEHGWIPCSERLPKKGEVVLITNGKGNVRCGQYRSEYDVRGETHYWWWKGKTIESVLAWMPLPTPYKGGDSE